jgi:hypothetical protein
MTGGTIRRLGHSYPAGGIVAQIKGIGGVSGERCQQTRGFKTGDHYHPDHFAVFKVGNVYHGIAGERVSRNAIRPRQIPGESHI